MSLKEKIFDYFIPKYEKDIIQTNNIKVAELIVNPLVVVAKIKIKNTSVVEEKNFKD